MLGLKTSFRLAAVVALMGALLVAPGRAEAAWKVAFRDDGRANWRELFGVVGASCNTITREGAGLRIQTCPVAAAGNRTAMIWARKQFSGKVKVEFDLVHFGREPTPGGTIRGLMLFARGDGTKGFVTDPTKWKAQCCSSPTGSTGYGPRTRGLQHNFVYRDHADTPDAAMRLRGLKGTPDGYGRLADAPSNFLIEDGRSYHVTATRIGNRLTIDVKDNGTGTTNSFTTTNAYIGGLGSGWIGFRQMQGRDELFSNFKISVDN